MLLLLIDENFNQRILRGLRLRIPALDYVIVQETAMQGMKDPPLLREAAGKLSQICSAVAPSLN